jgi:hypothetical protein
MNDLRHLADLIKRRNELEREITALIGRPAQIGHLGEYIASRIFNIKLVVSAAHKSIDGSFVDGSLQARTVNIKWYAMREAMLDITPDSLPDYYLVLTGPKSAAMSSRGRARPWTIDGVFLFHASGLVAQLNARGLKLGIATSVAQQLWEEAEIYPNQRCTSLVLSEDRRGQIALFGASVAGG